MTTSLSAHAPSARPVEDTPDEARLRGLTHQQLADRLAWLAWYQRGIFNAVMDYGQFVDDLAASTDPTNQDPDPGDPYGDDDFGNADEAGDPVPVCGACSGNLGLFIKFGLMWRHYAEGAALGEDEIYDPGHEAQPG